MMVSIVERIKDIFQLMFGSDVAIQVEPQQLFDASQKLTTKATSVQHQITDLSERLSSMSSYWEGNVFDFRKSTMKNEIEYMEEIVKMVQEYSLKLKTISEKYVTVENKNSDSANALATNIIS